MTLFLDPQCVIVLTAHLRADERVLRDLIRMPTAAGQADFSGVKHKVLQGGNGFDHLRARPEMIELRLGQWHHGASQGIDSVVSRRGRFSQGEAEVRVHFVSGTACRHGNCDLDASHPERSINTRTARALKSHMPVSTKQR